MTSGDRIEQCSYDKPKCLLHTISETNKFWSRECADVSNNGVFAQGSKRITYERSHLGSTRRTL